MIQLIISLDYYKDQFERKFLDKTSYFYQMQSRDLLKKYEVPDYLRFVLHLIQTESKWMDLYFDRRTQSELLSTMERVLIADHFQSILDRGFHELFTSQNMDLLRLLFDLAFSTSMIGQLKKYWASYIRT
jgi:transposase